MPDQTAPKAPKALASAGRALWRAVTGTYELRPDELRTLEDAARECDLIERLEEAQRDAPLTVKGSQGQQVASPFVSELRQHRGVLAGLLRGLHLPDSDSSGGLSTESVSAAARRSARARWDGKRRGTA
ncbi:hypothetical protein [Actinomycetospora cinnamomea]|uniref:Phage terminase small subunit n=1 Tax=Actinomycetospora cinnamomea TaxID=663609 RepID=A0A2U1FA50_9PSEU|nr:hypothetical protein [Actinomycetospora cinnamomea]PVZ09061.1 hypothetical protein C8D89_107225 [Actinomycetospora cinnamomea]